MKQRIPKKNILTPKQETYMRMEVRELRKQSARDKRTNEQIRIKNRKLIKTIRELRREHRKKDKRITELENRLEKVELNMKTYQAMIFKSGKKDKKSGVTEDGDLKINTQKGKRRKVGGQPGHPGSGRKKPIEANVVIEVRADICPDCGGKLTDQHGYHTHTVEDIPQLGENQVITTEYRKQRHWCSNCKKEVVAGIQGVIPYSRFGINILIYALIMKYVAHQSFERTSELLRIFYGLKLTEGAIVNMVDKAKEYLGSEYENYLNQIRGAPLIFGDETGFNISGEKVWVWGFFTELLCYYRIEYTRGKGVVDRILGNCTKNQVLVSDGYRAYFGQNVSNQSCWAHILRKANDVAKLKGSSDIAKELRDEIFKIFSEVKEITKRPFELKERKHNYEKYYKEINAITKRKYLREDAKRIQKYINGQKQYLLTALVREGVPLTNNLAERELRPIVLSRKNTYCCRSDKGADTLSVNMSVVQTLRKNKEDFVSTLRDLLLGKDPLLACPSGNSE